MYQNFSQFHKFFLFRITRMADNENMQKKLNELSELMVAFKGTYKQQFPQVMNDFEFIIEKFEAIKRMVIDAEYGGKVNHGFENDEK